MFRHPVVSQTLTFLNDVPRNTWYRDRLKHLARGKTVFEAGCGSGILAAYALESGARHYYGIDINKHRSRFTASVLDRLGYQGRHTLWCADASTITRQDIPDNIDVVLCEQTGHQMHNNFTIRDFYQNLGKIFPQATFLPDTWCLDAYIYEGCHAGEISDYTPKILLDDPSLPRDYKKVIDSFDFVQPSQIITDVLSISPNNAHDPLEFDLDLSDYRSATIILTDAVKFDTVPCISQSILTDCVVPARIVLDQAKGKFRFTWDPAARTTDFLRGFWRWNRHE